MLIAFGSLLVAVSLCLFRRRRRRAPVMSKGVLSARYELAVPDFEVLSPKPFRQDIRVAKPWTVIVIPSSARFTLEIQVETDDPSKATIVVDAHARSVAEDLTFWLCDQGVAWNVRAKRKGIEFTGSEPGSLNVLMGEVLYVSDPVTVKITRRVAGDAIEAALNSFALRQQAPPPAFANDLMVARQMFLAGLAVDSRTARFLIAYSSIAVLAAFKGGVNNQQAVDNILVAEDPTIPMVPRSGNTWSDTKYRAARNDFIHAEERGRDPATAMAALESLADEFNVLVGRILRKG